MDSKSFVFLGLISGPRQYRIPAFQRAYSWEKEDRETLWLDLLTQYETLKSVWHLEDEDREEALEKKSPHYLGTIVLSGPSLLGVPKSDIIDGQQRITTILLAFCALRDHWAKLIERTEDAASAEVKRKHLSATYLVNEGQAGSERYRVLPLSTDEKAFKAIVDYSGSGKIDATVLGLEAGDSERMLQAYRFYRTEMSRRTVPDGNVQLKRFAELYPLDPAIVEQALAHRLSVISIETKNNDDTNAIFESLNAKGRPLTQLDLLRNYIFMTLGSRANQVLNEDWLPIEKLYLPSRKDMESFVWADIVSRGTNVLQKRTYRTVQSELRETGATQAAAEEYVKRLKRRAPMFAQIIDPSRVPDLELGKALDRLLRAGGKTARPLVLWLLEEEFEERCDRRETIRCVGFLESFITRRYLCALPPNNLNSMFGVMLSKLNSPAGALGLSAGSVDDRLASALLSVSKDWPDDNAIRAGISNHDFYHNGDARQRHHVLRQLDLSFGYDLVPGYEESDRSIEHILPQKRDSSEWITDLRGLNQDLRTVQERWLHTLGNLTLVAPSDNSSLGSKRFPSKSVVYEGLGYKMTRDIARLGTDVAGERLWGAHDIEQRAERLAAIAVEVWPRPGEGVIGAPDSFAGASEGEFDDEGDGLVPFTSSIEEVEESGE